MGQLRAADAVTWRPTLWPTNHPADSDEVDAVADALGIVFPDDYRALVVSHQGESPEPNLFDYVEHGRATTGAMGVLFHFSPDEADPVVAGYHILRKRPDWLPGYLLPFSEDPGGNFIAFDFRPDGQPPVVFVDHEADDEDRLVSFVAPSVETLVAMLHPLS